MSLVEIARFTDGYDADIAVSFLRRHGVKAVRPRRDSPWAYMALGEVTVFAEAAQAEEARALLSRVLAGDFVDDDPTAKSIRGLGAKLSQMILPAPGYRRPQRRVLLAPLLLLAASLFGVLLTQFVIALMGGEIG